MPADRLHKPSAAVIVLLGGPGSGKGTHGQALAAALGYVHLSSGEHLRDHIRRGTPVGLQAGELIANGQLVPDELASAMMRELLGGGAATGGYVLDGYPRSLAQAKALEEIVAALGWEVTQALYLAVSDDEILRRLAGRLTCRACGRIYHSTSNPPTVEGVCDGCGGELFRRADDEPATIRQRISGFHRTIEPLLSFYRQSGRLAEVFAEGPAAEVSARVIAQAERGQRDESH